MWKPVALALPLTTLSPSSEVSSSMGLSVKRVPVNSSCTPPRNSRKHKHNRSHVRPLPSSLAAVSEGPIGTHRHSHDLFAGVLDLLGSHLPDGLVGDGAVLGRARYDHVKREHGHLE